MSGINRAARYGIIVKGGSALEQVGEADAVVFDKTGTLTAGTPIVDKVVSLNGYGSADVLRLGAGLEQLSSHPMARALVTAANANGTRGPSAQPEAGDPPDEPPLPLPTDLVESAGQGVSGRVEGHVVDVGSVAFAAAQGLQGMETVHRARLDAGAADETVAVIGVDGKAAGLVVYADPPRPNARQLVEKLKTLGVRQTGMLTGDDSLTANAIAAEVGIDSVDAELLPAGKVAAVQDFSRRHHGVVMVGDGINDAPALATAMVGIALGAHGAAVSAEAADIVVVADDLGRVGDTVEIGKRTLHIAKQSIVAGLGVSSLMMLVAAFGYIPPAVGALLQELLDVGVILNALRAR
jgi:cation transport ATPase